MIAEYFLGERFLYIEEFLERLLTPKAKAVFLLKVLVSSGHFVIRNYKYIMYNNSVLYSQIKITFYAIIYCQF